MTTEQSPPGVNMTGPLGVMRWLTILSMAVAIGMLTLGAAVLLDARDDAWRQAEQAYGNLALALERDVGRNISAYDLSVQGAANALRQPGIDRVSPEIRHAAMFGNAASADDLGALLVLDREGDIVAESTSMEPHRLNLSDRDYFRVQRERSDVGLYVSRPFNSRFPGENASMAISRRIFGAQGEFEGIVMGTFHLAYFQSLFERLNLGSNGYVTLSRRDGREIIRYPFREGGADLDLADSETFRRFTASPTGQFVGKPAIDGVERLFTFRSVGLLPLTLAVAVSVDDIYAAWWRKAVTIGSILAVLCGATVVLCLLFRREMARRMAAEAALMDTAEKLSVMAATDELSGLANRRAFEAEFNREWRRAIRAETTLAVLMVDADFFKPYNDRYGHQGGDLVLQTISRCIFQAIRRPGDVAARYGGEEFVALLPETDIVAALTIAERIRGAVASLDIPHGGSPTGRVTVSIGVAAIQPLPGEAEGVLLRMADTALYDAKDSGRDCVRVADCNGPPVLAWTPDYVTTTRPTVAQG